MVYYRSWLFFRNEDFETSSEDAYNTFQAIQRAHYPVRIVLQWHQWVSSLFNDYGVSDEDRKRSAQLHEAWVELAVRDESMEYRFFKCCLEHEQAHTLVFAAQGRRNLREYDASDGLLDRADSLFQAAKANCTVIGEETKQIRELRFDLKMQRAWLRQEQGKKEEHVRLVYEPWSAMRPDDESCANLMSSFVGLEGRNNLLNTEWPPVPGAAPELDPDHYLMSLPTSWLAAGAPLTIHNRFEFRFCQLVHLVIPDQMPTWEALVESAQSSWLGMNRFGEIALWFASNALDKSNLGVRRLAIQLLEVVRWYYKEIEKLNRQELKALQLLMEADKHSS